MLLVTQLNTNLGGFTPVIDESGKITGYKTTIGGADTVFPFKNNEYQFETSYNAASGTYTVCTSNYDGNAVLYAYMRNNDDISMTIYQNNNILKKLSAVYGTCWESTVPCKKGDVFKFVTGKSAQYNLWGMTVLIIPT